MRISIISVGPPYRGGISDLSALISTELSRSHDVQFVNYKRQYPGFLFPGKTEYKEGETTGDFSSDRIIDSINPLSWFKAVYRIRQFHPDIVLFRYWNPFFAPSLNMISRFLKRNGLKVAALVDNLIPHEPSFMDRWMARAVLKHVDMVFTMSESVLKDVRSVTDHQRVYRLFHPIYEIYRKTHTKEEARQLLKIEKKRMILFFGLIRPYKGLDTLIQALGYLGDQVEDMTTFILGESYEDEGRYLKLIREYRLEDSVMFKNEFVSDDMLPVYFAAADVLVLPYKTATQSGIIGIAFQMDRPVIATRVGGLGEYIKDGQTGYLVPPEDPEALAEAIKKFFINHEEVVFSDNVTQVKHNFSIAAFCSRLEGILNE